LAGMGSGLYRRGKLCGRERVPGLQLSVITRWSGLTCLASWETGSSWDFSSRETSRGVWQAVINQGSGFNVSFGTLHLPQECQGPNTPAFCWYYGHQSI
jgi:hypothetical protein